MRLALDHPGNFPSPLIGFDPRWKILSTLLVVVAVVLVRTLPVAGAAWFLSLTLAHYARLPGRWYARRLGTVALLAALFLVWLPFLEPGPGWTIGPVSISQPGVVLAVVLLFKALTIVTLFLVMWATSPPGATLKAAQALRVPGIVLHLCSLTYRYLHLFAEELARIRVALTVRGYRRGSGARKYRIVAGVVGILLVRSFERAERVTQAMRCRGFDGRYRSLVCLQTRLHDIAGAMLSILVAASLICCDVFL